MKKYFVFFFVVSVSVYYPQNLDSLFSRYMEIRGMGNHNQQITSSANEQDKCLFGIVNNIKMNFNSFSLKQKAILTSMFKRPVTDTSFISPSGKFKIHYNKKGADTPTYNVDELAKAADYTYKYEIDSLKYLPPPDDGDGLYDIFVQSLGAKIYGSTQPDSQLTVNTSTTFMLVNFDYSGFPTSGSNALKVTVAHEFHHAIQLGNYIYRPSDLYYHELTSTSMEDIVYNDINDYYEYMPSYFNNTGRALAQNNGYNIAIWNLFLRDRFNVNIIKEIWEAMPIQRAVQCFNTVLEKHGSSLLKELNEFGIWTYFTNSRSVRGQYFKEAAYYPLIKPSMQTSLTNSSTVVKVTSEAVSNNFVEITSGANTIISLVTNADVQSSASEQGTTIPFDLSISQNQSPGFGQIYNGYYSKLTSSSPSLLTDTYFFNNKLVGKIESVQFAYPQPFNYSKYSVLYFPAELTSDGTTELSIFSIDMNLVFSTQTTIIPGNKVVVGWNALDNDGRKLSSGIYFYVVKSGDKILKGKFAVLNN